MKKLTIAICIIIIFIWGMIAEHIMIVPRITKNTRKATILEINDRLRCQWYLVRFEDTTGGISMRFPASAKLIRMDRKHDSRVAELYR